MQPSFTLRHIDGDWYEHYLDSGEQALLSEFCLSRAPADDQPLCYSPMLRREEARL